MKLNNKGIGFFEVLAASIIISIVFLTITTNVLDVYEMNLTTHRKSSAYSIATEVYNNLTTTSLETFEYDIDYFNLVASYDSGNCSIPSGSGSLQKIFEESVCLSFMSKTIDGYEYKKGDIIFYVYEQDLDTMNAIINNSTYNAHPLLIEYAKEVNTNSDYDDTDTDLFYRVSIIVKYGEEDNFAIILNGVLRR